MNMSLSLFLPGEIVIQENMHGNAMFFISKGPMEVFIHNKPDKSDKTISDENKEKSADEIA